VPDPALENKKGCSLALTTFVNCGLADAWSSACHLWILNKTVSVEEAYRSGEEHILGSCYQDLILALPLTVLLSKS
jgi:hypothetical protein